MIRIATFNVENLFQRPRAMNQPTWSAGQPALDAAARLNALFNRRRYTPADCRKMLRLLGKWGLLATRGQNEFLQLRRIRGELFERPHGARPRIVARGRGDWVGWVELKKELIADPAIENTARVILEVNPDILVLVEVEDRVSLQRFVDGFLAPKQAELGLAPYAHNMVIDGNDPRGIDLGILTRFPITRIVSHIDHRTEGRPTFSRDCPEYWLDAAGGIVLLANHFASKGSDRTGSRRRVQAEAVRNLYTRLRRQHRLVLVAGDLNDTPRAPCLTPLIARTDLRDAMTLPQYHGLPGTYGRGTAREKLDYLLLSPSLRRFVKAVNVFRKGYYAPRKWESFENITAENRERYQASDHHCLWVDVDV